MRYMIAKVTPKQTIDFGSMFGAAPKVDFENGFYDTIELAEAEIRKNQKRLDEASDRTWSEASDVKQRSMEQSMKDGAVMQAEMYIIVPVETVVQLTTVPKHLREV